MKAKHKPLDDLLAEIRTDKAEIVARLQSGEIHLVVRFNQFERIW
jgi:hypothetical protein